MSKLYLLTFVILGVAISKRAVLEDDLELDEDDLSIKGKGYQSA